MSAHAASAAPCAPVDGASLRELMATDPALGSVCAMPGFAPALGTLSAHKALELIDELALPQGAPARVNLYKAWLAHAGEKPHLTALMWFNLAVEYDAAGDQRSKVLALQAALTVNKGCHQAAVNLGLTFEAERDTDRALSTWSDALQGDDARVLLLNNMGRVLEGRKQFAQAKDRYTQSLLTRPDQRSVLHHLINLRQKTCDWPVYRDDVPGVTQADWRSATRALSLLAASDDVAGQCAGNASWIAERMPEVPRFAHPPRQRTGRIRIGYLSTDFCMHPIAYLIAELIERHDRSVFEVFGFCATKDDGSSTRQRLVAAFDHFIPIRDLDDRAAAALIHRHDIDVLIDLNGLTLGTRLQILRFRPAPLQLTYLGYNGPIPLPELDYIIADDYVVPADQASAYAPPPLVMPGCFQVNDSRLDVRFDLRRSDVGLPDDAFVFCCFSNTYKITEDLFDAWMRILAQTDGSVLWLYVDNEDAADNLRRLCRGRGLADERIVFARRVEPSLYRGQLALADLFLDTFPYNAGTTASDALRVGLPLLTMSGASFIARMAGSLLSAMDLADCIVPDLDAYVAFATHLARDPDAYAALRARVDPARWRATLGDTQRFCAAFETRLVELVRALPTSDRRQITVS